MKYTFLICTLIAVFAILMIAIFAKFKLSNDQYDRIKTIVTRWDYLVLFIAAIVKAFEVPYGMETIAVVAALGATLAGLMDISTRQYIDDGQTQMFNEDLLKDMVGYYEGEYEEIEEEGEE